MRRPVVDAAKRLTPPLPQPNVPCTCTAHAGSSGIATYDLVGVDANFNQVKVGNAYVFVSYQRRLYISLQFMCRWAVFSA